MGEAPEPAPERGGRPKERRSKGQNGKRPEARRKVKEYYMPRRAAAVRREIQPDAKYNNRLVTQLINKVLLDGKKSIAEGIVYGAFDIIREKTNSDPLTVFKKAMDNVRPTLETKSKRVGGASYQVPMEVSSRRSTTLAIRWIVDFSRKRKEHTMKQRLAAEIMDAAENTGAAVKRREDVYKMAEANRAFSHYRW